MSVKDNYALLEYIEESSVKRLLESCERQFNGGYCCYIPIPNQNNHKCVQVRPWKLSDIHYKSNPAHTTKPNPWTVITEYHPKF
jgi:hypothetical protein